MCHHMLRAPVGAAGGCRCRHRRCTHAAAAAVCHIRTLKGLYSRSSTSSQHQQSSTITAFVVCTTPSTTTFQPAAHLAFVRGPPFQIRGSQQHIPGSIIHQFRFQRTPERKVCFQRIYWIVGHVGIAMLIFPERFAAGTFTSRPRNHARETSTDVAGCRSLRFHRNHRRRRRRSEVHRQPRVGT